MTIPQNPKIISRLSLMCPSLRKRVYNIRIAAYVLIALPSLMAS